MFWKKIIVISLLCAVFALPGCKKKTLSIYNWDDYLNPDLVKKFEKQYGCAIALSIFASNEEMYEKVKGGAEYDVLVPSSYIAKRMYEDRMLKVLDHSKLPHKKNIDIAFMRRSIDSNMKYSIPYMTVFTGIAYNKKMVKDFRPSWSMFGRTDLAGKMGMVDDLREVIGAALKSNGYSYNTTDDIQLRKAANVLEGWKGNLIGFESNTDLGEKLKSGALYLIQQYNGDFMQFFADNEDFAFVVPNEGTAMSLDVMVIARNTMNEDLAYKFLDFCLDAENAKDNMDYISYISPNVAARKLMSSDFIDDPVINPPPDIILKSDHLTDVGDNLIKYNRIWESLSK